jgi:hypothetical protein
MRVCSILFLSDILSSLRLSDLLSPIMI